MKLKRSKKLIVVGAIAAIPVIVTATPAKAFLDILSGLSGNPIFDLASDLFLEDALASLEEVMGLFDETVGMAEELMNSNGMALFDLLTTNSDDYCSGFVGNLEICNEVTVGGGSIQDLLSSSAGSLGIADPEKYAQDLIEEALNGDNPTAWGLGGSPFGLLDQIQNAGDRGLTTLITGTTLSESGQDMMQTRLEEQENIVLNSHELAERALRMPTTEGLLAAQTAMEANQQLLDQSMLSAMEQGRIDQALTNRNLSNISKALDQEAVERQVERQIDATHIIRSAGVQMY